MIEFTKLSSKGQVVIPQRIRESMKLEEGSLLAVMPQNDTLCLKKIEMPKIKTWKQATKPFKEAAKKSGFTKEDLDKLIIEARIKNESSS